MESANARLQSSPIDPAAQQHHGNCRSILQSVKNKLMEGRKVRSRIRWKHKGDMVSAEFFKAVQDRSSSTIINCLKNECEEVQ